VLPFGLGPLQNKKKKSTNFLIKTKFPLIPSTGRFFYEAPQLFFHYNRAKEIEFYPFFFSDVNKMRALDQMHQI